MYVPLPRNMNNMKVQHLDHHMMKYNQSVWSPGAKYLRHFTCKIKKEKSLRKE